MIKEIRHSRRDALKAAAAVAAAAFTTPIGAQPPAPSSITPALITAARREGKLAFYTSLDLAVAERFARTFEARFPGVAVRVERTGAERLFTRIQHEMESHIYAVDVVNTADAAHCLVWKRNGW